MAEPIKPTLDPKVIELINQVNLTTTPGQSESQTVAKGSVAELMENNPELAAKLATIGAELAKNVRLGGLVDSERLGRL